MSASDCTEAPGLVSTPFLTGARPGAAQACRSRLKAAMATSASAASDNQPMSMTGASLMLALEMVTDPREKGLRTAALRSPTVVVPLPVHAKLPARYSISGTSDGRPASRDVVREEKLARDAAGSFSKAM